MALSYINNVEFKRSHDGGAQLMRKYSEASGTTVGNAGELCTISSGKIPTYTDAALVLGILETAMTDVEDTELTVSVIVPGDEVEISVYNSTAPAAVTVANLGIGYGTKVIGATTSRKTVIDVADTTNNVFVIHKIVSAGVASTTPARVIATLNPAFAIYGGAGI
jgi:hypothetical protein